MNITPHLMFTGQAEAAMDFYVRLFPDSRVVSVERYGAGEPGPEGSIRLASFELNGMRFNCIDSYVQHAFTFTPSLSLYVESDGREQFDHLVAGLSDGGAFMMPPDNYGFSTLFAWVQDRYGVSWQINLA